LGFGVPGSGSKVMKVMVMGIKRFLTWGLSGGIVPDVKVMSRVQGKLGFRV